MNLKVILTVVGSDRPGLTQAIAEAVHAGGGNWLESHLSRLGGRYVGSVLVELPKHRLGELEDAARRIDAIGLKLELVEVTDVNEREGEPVGLDIVGQDRPGIVREVTAVLAALDVNIEELATTIEASAWSGAPLFRAKVKMRVPATVSARSVREALEGISGEIMVDFTIEPAGS
jgi:glycine cleavage system regulatory protein